MISEATKKISEGKSLSRKESRDVFREIMAGEAKHEEIVDFLVALSEKGEAVEEIQGACESMRDASSKVDYSGEADLLDIVGTGGDGKNSFNVSTASAFVAAGAGCIVAKHGNRGVSSKSGAADVLEALGVNVEKTNEENSEILSRIGIAFLFAQKHHPAMRHAAGPRKEIGKRTIFNILGPITNPAGADTYLLGAYSEELAKKLAEVLAGLGTKRALVVHGNGFDEATLTGNTVVFHVENSNVERKEYSPEDFGLPRCEEKGLAVENPEESAEAIMKILSGKDSGPKRDTVLLNAGLGIYANMKAKTISEGIEKARESIGSGKALEKLNLLRGA